LEPTGLAEAQMARAEVRRTERPCMVIVFGN
jgi:hypothetical protein